MGSAIAVGAIVKSVVTFPDVPRGSQGIVYEDYGSGVSISWQLGECLQAVEDVPQMAIVSCSKCGKQHVRDGFDKEREFDYLEVVDHGQD